MAHKASLLDANVLYSAPLRDIFVQLAFDQFVTVRWTSAIHEEWISSLASNRPNIQITQLEKVRDIINNAVPDYLNILKKSGLCRLSAALAPWISDI